MRYVALLALAACDAGAAVPSTRIDAPRILGVQAEPPVVDAAGAATVRALVVDEAGDEAGAPVAMRACSPWAPIVDPSRDCGADASVALAVGAGGAATLDVAAVLAAFPPPGDPPPLDDPCPLAYPYVELPLIVETDVGGVHLTAAKHVRITAAPVTRRNPALGELLRDGDSLTVRPQIAAFDDACTGDDPPAIVHEPLSIYLFTTAGDLGDTHVDASYDVAGVESLGTTTFTGGPAVLWAVALDGDGGLGWARYPLTGP